MFDLCALSRDFALKEIIASAFKTNCGDWKGYDVKDDEEDQKSYAPGGTVLQSLTEKKVSLAISRAWGRTEIHGFSSYDIGLSTAQ